MATSSLHSSPLAKAIALVLVEADPYCVEKYMKQAPRDDEYDLEAQDICKIIGNSKLDKQKASEFLTMTFAKWGYDIKDCKNWHDAGDAIAWLVSNKKKWMLV